MAVWRKLLRLSLELLDPSGHVAIDAMYFDRSQASTHYLKRCDRNVQTVQTTFIVDTALESGLDDHLEQEREAIKRISDSAAFDEGLSAFFENRPPEWRTD